MKYLEQIEDYLNGKLSDKERTAFEEACQNDQELAEELAFYIQAQQALLENKKQTFQNRYEKLKKTTPEKGIIHQLNTTNNRRYLQIAAGLAILAIAVFSLLPYILGDSIHQQLAQKNTSIFPLNEQITRGTQESKWFDAAVDFIKNEDYQAALEAVDTLDNKSVLAIKGYCFFELQQYEQSATNYEQYLLQEKNTYERLVTKWNLALAYRYLGDKKKEKEILKTIDDNNKEKLLNKLNQITE